MPPLPGLAEKTAAAPMHMGLFPEERPTETEAAAEELTLMVTAALVIVVGLAQVALEVNTQVTRSPLLRPELLNVGLFVPAFEPFIFH